MNLASLVALFGTAAAQTYAAARAMIEQDGSDLPLPKPIDTVAANTTGRLHHVREAMGFSLAKARHATRDAERELREDYLSRTGRSELAAGEPDTS